MYCSTSAGHEHKLPHAGPHVNLFSVYAYGRSQRAHACICAHYGLVGGGNFGLGEYVGAYTTYVFERALPLGALVAVLNTSLMAFVFRLLYDALAMGGGYLRFQPPQMRRLPIPASLSSAAPSAVSVARLAKLATQSASLRDVASASRTPGERDSLRRQIVALDAEIDRLVYDLYGLTEDEITLVEAL